MASKRKTNSSLSTNAKKTRVDDVGSGKVNKKGDFFNGLSFYILKAGIEKARLDIFQNQILQNGGEIQQNYSFGSGVSHIIVDDKMEVDRMLRLLGVTEFPSVIVAKTQWISMCLKKKELVECTEYQLKCEVHSPDLSSSPKHTESICKEGKSEKCLKINDSPSRTDNMQPFSEHERSKEPTHFRHRQENDMNDDSDYEASDEENETDRNHSELASTIGITEKNIAVDKWICAQSSKNPMPNHNKHITDKLEEMVKAYDSTNDKWRSYGYQKCIRALMRHPKAISSWEEAKSLPAVGSRLADKIWEIAQSGELRKLNEFKSSEEIRCLELFNNVWGAGPHTAQLWFQQGFRTIDDLQTKAKLTSQQKVGVRLYEELLERMPREEAGKIADVVREAAESIQSGIIAQACGSYRRGKATCGDVDVLVTHPDGKSHKGIFGKLLDKLHETGFLTDDLVSSEDNGNQKKYLGVCKLPGEGTKHRRLDIIVVPYHEYACAVLYFTGSAHFNRSLRLLCKRQDMSLSEHALRYGVIRQGGERVHEGTIIPTPTEESVFEILKIPFRPPEERDH